MIRKNSGSNNMCSLECNYIGAVRHNRVNNGKKTLFFLNYAATHPDNVLTYNKSNMVLAVHSNTSYLTKPKARIRVGGHFFVGVTCQQMDNSFNYKQQYTPHLRILKLVVASAAEAELGTLFLGM